MTAKRELTLINIFIDLAINVAVHIMLVNIVVDVVNLTVVLSSTSV